MYIIILTFIKYDRLLYFTQTHEDYNENRIGDLFIQPDETKEPEFVASNVILSSFFFDEVTDQLFFVNENNELFESTVGKENKKIADNVDFFIFSDDRKYIFYKSKDDNLYGVNDKGDTIKIASSPDYYTFNNDDVYFINEHNTLKVFNLKDRTEMNLADDVTFFDLSEHDDSITYLNDKSLLFYLKNKKADPVTLSSDKIIQYLNPNADGTLVYITNDDVLYKTNVSSPDKTEKIATNVNNIHFFEDHIYYRDTNRDFFTVPTKGGDPVKISSDIGILRTDESSIVLFEENDGLYKIDNISGKVKIASQSLEYMLAPNGEIAYITKDLELYLNDTKINDDVFFFSVNQNRLVYSTEEDILYSMSESESTRIDIDVTDYSYAYHNNELVYENDLDFAKIAGIWRTEFDHFIEIKEDGTVISLLDGYEEKYEFNLGEVNKLYASNDYENIMIRLDHDDSITFHYDMDDATGKVTYTKSDRETADEYLKME